MKPAMSDQLNFSPPVSRSCASLFPSPGSAEVRKTTAISGRKLCESYAKWIPPEDSPLGAFLRTCLGSYRWNSTIASLTWKASATPAGRLLFRLVPRTPDTGEIASGLWLTPTLTLAVKMWPTPRGEEKSQHNSADMGLALSAQVKYFTPDANCHKGGNRKGQINQQVPGSLNPAWVEWLMGYPIGWTETTSPGRTTRTRKPRAPRPASRTVSSD